ncbi:DoxX family protein [Pendulispora brunnea]|uniref:DoxX family protein n=1 Tax=Pendulispora brunnea TaxID=2905690 RepID=A0ABZ2KJW1_9BACT
MNDWNQERLSALGPTALRLGLAAVFFAHSYAKLFVFTLPGTAQFFEAHGFPGWTAYPVTAAELLGGVALLLGVRTRIVAAALIAVLLGALRVHAPNGWMFSNAGGGWEYVAFLIAALGAQVLLGGGAYALRSANPASDARSLP